MEQLTEAQIRASFINATQGEAKRLRVPADLADQPWENLDFLGWIDPRAPMQSYLVVPLAGTATGIQLRRNVGGQGPKRVRMCSLCLTTHPATGVSLMVAPRAGSAGREGNSLGIDICSDLNCSLYVRGIVAPPTMSHARETLPVEDKIARLQTNAETFAARVAGRTG